MPSTGKRGCRPGSRHPPNSGGGCRLSFCFVISNDEIDEPAHGSGRWVIS
jgi:hypothetical protein